MNKEHYIDGPMKTGFLTADSHIQNDQMIAIVQSKSRVGKSVIDPIDFSLNSARLKMMSDECEYEIFGGRLNNIMEMIEKLKHDSRKSRYLSTQDYFCGLMVLIEQFGGMVIKGFHKEDTEIHEIQMAAVKSVGYSIKYIDNPKERVALEAVKSKPLAINYVVDPPYDVQLEAITKDKEAFKLIKNLHPDIELYLKIEKMVE